MSVYVLILAAGFSSRMAPAFKPLLELPFAQGRQSALARLCALYQAEGVEVIVVGGHCQEKVKNAALACGADFALNPQPERGMLSSIQAGLGRTPEGCEAFFIQPVDIPLLRPITVRFLLNAAQEKNCEVLTPAFRGRSGHPPLVRGTLRSLILNGGHEEGLRGLLRDCGAVTCQIPTPDSLILRDMDIEEDYRELCQLAPATDMLSPEEAWTLLRMRNLPEHILAHSRAVGSLAAAFAQAIADKAEYKPDSRIARAGGLLHDICNGQPQHEKVAGRLFRSWGMESLARLVEDHRDILLPAEAPITERELVYLADKYVQGSSPVSLEERFAQKLQVYATTQEACLALEGRRERAVSMARRFALESGRDAQDLAFATLSFMPNDAICA